MNRKMILLTLILACLLFGCSPSEADIQAAIVLTEAAKPTSTFTPEPTNTPEPSPTPEPTLTNTSEPSPTPEPSLTPIVLPDVLGQTFSGITIIYRDDFDFIMEGLAPEGWETTEKYSLKETENNELKINGIEEPGLVFYYPEEVINPGKGVYFKFKYVGTQGTFTLGFDNIQKNGERFANGEDGFHSVAMQMAGPGGQVLSAHIMQNKFQGDGYFKGNLKLQEDAWYQIALGFDEKGDYIIKIWDPDAPLSPLTYIRNWADFPTAYYFISWVSTTRTLWMDDFTIFKFDSIIQGQE
jgi:hypothetical protein